MVAMSTEESIEMMIRSARRYRHLAFVAIVCVAGCSPTVKIEAPDKPIVINMNIKVEQEVRVRLEKDIDQATNARPGVF